MSTRTTQEHVIPSLPRYGGFGLTFESSIPCPALAEADAPADVRVRDGDVPTRLEGAEARGVCYEVGPDDYLLRVDGVARYRVRGGEDIVVRREPATSDRELWTFLLGPPLGALLHQRGAVPFRAASVEIDGGALLLPGATTTGSSTLAGVFRERGRPVMAERISAVTSSLPPDGGEPGPVGGFRVHPGKREIHLCFDACEELGVEPESPPVLAGLPRRIVPLDGPPPAPVPPTRICVMTVGGAEEMVVERVRGPDALTLLRAAVYRSELLTASGRPRHFRLLVALARRCPVYRMTRPATGVSPEAVVDRLLELGS